MHVHLTGEFGVVHKGYVQVKADSVIVAIKTLKGIIAIIYILGLYYYYQMPDVSFRFL